MPARNRRRTSNKKSSSSSSKKRQLHQPPFAEQQQEEGAEALAESTSSSSSKSEEDSADSSSSSSSSGSDDDDSSQKDDNELQNLKRVGFTDENAAWLKPKNNKKKEDKKHILLGSSSSSSSEDDGDDDEESDDELLDIEREAEQIDRDLEEEQELAEREMQQTISDHTSVYHLPTPAELQRGSEDNDDDALVMMQPPSELRSHVEQILEVLADFQQRREPGRSRQEYLQVLGNFLAELYGYLPELIEYFLTMFSPAECVEFVHASDQPRPLVVRTNTLKTRRKDLAAALIKRGVSLDPLSNWSKVGLKIVESPVPIGATPEYLSGRYMLQSAASMCPVLALEPQPNEFILDMSAAPGGKTSYIAQLMKNTGVLIANDIKADRQKATVANLHRLGVRNVITTQYDGRKLGRLFKNRFDRILLDAPCSGLGVISRDPTVKIRRTLEDVRQCAHLQKELLLSAIDALKKSNGTLVYSTCSVSIFENEDVVQYARSKRDIRIVDTGLDFGRPGFVRYQQRRFHPSMALSRRFYPHTVNMDGFFVCKIQKLSDKRPDDDKAESKTEEEAEEQGTLKVEGEDEKTEAPRAGKSNIIKKKTKTGSKNKRKQEETISVNDSKKKVKVALPPKIVAPKKQKTNAKVTKPRRPKKALSEV